MCSGCGGGMLQDTTSNCSNCEMQFVRLPWLPGLFPLTVDFNVTRVPYGNGCMVLEPHTQFSKVKCVPPSQLVALPPGQLVASSDVHCSHVIVLRLPLPPVPSPGMS